MPADWTKIEHLLTVLFPLTFVKGIVELGRVVGKAQWVNTGRVYNYKWQERLEYCDEFTLKRKRVFLEKCVINHYLLLWHKTNIKKWRQLLVTFQSKPISLEVGILREIFLTLLPPPPNPLTLITLADSDFIRCFRSWSCSHCDLTFSSPAILNLHSFVHVTNNIEEEDDDIIIPEDIQDFFMKPHERVPCPECPQVSYVDYIFHWSIYYLLTNISCYTYKECHINQFEFC